MQEYMPTDKQYNGQLIEQYQMLKRIREKAVEEKSTATINQIDKEIVYIKLKLQPIELPEEEYL